MAWTAFPTWIVGQVSTASDWNTYVAANMNFLAVVPAGFLYSSSGGTIPYNTATQITGNSTGYLQGGMTVSSDSLIAPVAGVYNVTAAIYWPAWSTNAASLVATYVFQNGSAIRIATKAVNVGDYTVIQNTTRALCSAGDSLSYFGYHNSATTQAYNGGGQGTFMCADLVSGTTAAG